MGAGPREGPVQPRLINLATGRSGSLDEGDPDGDGWGLGPLR